MIQGRSKERFFSCDLPDHPWTGTAFSIAVPWWRLLALCVVGLTSAHADAVDEWNDLAVVVAAEALHHALTASSLAICVE